MRRAVVDTNVLVAYLFEDDEHHRRAEELLSGMDQWILPTLVLHELAWFLRRHDIALDVISEIVSWEQVVVEPADVGDVLFAVKNARNPYDYNDLVIYAVSLRLGVPFLSFDEDFLSRYVSP